jgi:hypothetical protein
MITGCESGKAAPWPAALAVDLAPIRCPDPDKKLKAEAKRVTPPPAGPLMAGTTKALIDSFRASELRKNAALARSLGEYDRCRDLPAAAPVPAVAKPTS